MGKKKKLLIFLICVIAAVSLSVTAVVWTVLSGNKQKEESYSRTIVYLGDSICEAILGSTPLSERDSYAYYAVIGRRNNFRYVESSVSGDSTFKMYGRLTNADTPAKERQYWVSQADIIHISILGNDLLTGNLGKKACDALEGNYEEINAILTDSRYYFDLSIKRIRELNPTALIMVNTVYNPLDPNSTLLSEQQKEDIVALGGEEAIREAGADLLTRLNSVIYNYLEEHPGAFEVIDVYSAFDKLYREDYENGVRLLYGDWLHPSVEGHGLIADLIQDRLEQLGLTEKSPAVSRYKTLRKEQLVRLFSETTVDIEAVKTAIDTSADCPGVTNAYFAGIRGVTPAYVKEDGSAPDIVRHKGNVFAETKTFNLSSFVLDKSDFTVFADTEKSTFTFRNDGTFSVKLKPSAMAILGVNVFLMTSLKDEGLNLAEDLGPGGFATGVSVYIENIFPGFDFRYLKKDIALISSCGIYINGLDYESANVKALIDSMEESATIPRGFILPSDLFIELRGNYFVEQTGEFTNIHMCVGNVSENGYPFLYCTLHTESDGTEWVETSIEVSKVTITAGK